MGRAVLLFAALDGLGRDRLGNDALGHGALQRIDALPCYRGDLKEGQLPLLGDCYWATSSGDVFLNGNPIHVIAPREWEGEDWISTPSNTHRRFLIDFLGKTRSLGCTAASFCYVARGSAVGALLTRAAHYLTPAQNRELGVGFGTMLVGSLFSVAVFNLIDARTNPGETLSVDQTTSLLREPNTRRLPSVARSPSAASPLVLLEVFARSHYQAGAEVTCHVYLEIGCAIRAASSCHCDRGLRWWVE